MGHSVLNSAEDPLDSNQARLSPARVQSLAMTWLVFISIFSRHTPFLHGKMPVFFFFLFDDPRAISRLSLTCSIMYNLQNNMICLEYQIQNRGVEIVQFGFF